MRKILQHLNDKSLYPDSLLQLDWMPGCLCVDNDNGNHWITVTDFGTDIRLIFNAIGLDYESKPNLNALLNDTKSEDFEWGVTVNSKLGIYGMYIGSERLEFSQALLSTDDNDDDNDNNEKDSYLKDKFPIRSIETARTRMLFTDTDEWKNSFIGVGFYYNSNTDEFLTYKQYYDVPERGIVHVYKKRPGQPVEFIIEEATKDMSKFRDDIGVKKLIGPDIVVASIDRSQSSKNDTYLMIQTQNYINGVI